MADVYSIWPEENEIRPVVAYETVLNGRTYIGLNYAFLWLLMFNVFNMYIIDNMQMCDMNKSFDTNNNVHYFTRFIF